jgi:hypothetical protein
VDQITRERIAERLKERGATLPCPRCAHRDFALVDGYFNPPLQQDLSVMSLGGPSIPVIVVACKRCGYLAQHAAGALGLLPAAEKEETHGS